MLQALKVFAMRKYYRLVSKHSWRGHLAASQAGVALEVSGAAGGLPARFYSGSHHSDRPLLLYFHGGGWVIGDLDTHEPFCRALCETSGCSVLSVQYRLAPEHPFPAAQDDALAAAAWVTSNQDQLAAPGNGSMIIAGDSAGGQLACATCLDADADTRAAIAGCVLIYPACDHYSSLPPSYVERARGQALTSKLMVWFWDTYLRGADSDDDDTRRAFPLRSPRLGTLPPAFVVTAEYDPLRDEGRKLAGAIAAEDVPTTHLHYGEAAHGFACSEGPNADSRAMLTELATWLENHCTTWAGAGS